MTDNIIDFHTHPFQDRTKCLNFYPEMDNLNASGMKQQLQNAGVTHICGSVLEKNGDISGFEDVKSLNREALKLKDALGDFYTPGFHIHPAFLEESCEEIDIMHSQGVKLMGELVPYMHHWGSFSEKNWMEIMDAAQHYRMICSYHTPFAYDMHEMLRSHPGIIFVAAHPGDRDRVQEHIEMMKRHENLYLDLSGTGLFRFGLVKHLVNAVGPERILFGTDYPICNPRMYVQAVLGEDISDGDREKILFENARTLLDL